MMRYYEEHFLFMRSEERNLILRSLTEERERIAAELRDASMNQDRRPKRRNKRRG